MYLEAAARREQIQAAQALMLNALAAQGESKAIQDAYSKLTGE